MESLPLYINWIFILTTLATVWIFYLATNRSANMLLILFVWLILQGFIAGSGFYRVTNGIPPRFFLLVGPPFLFILSAFVTVTGRQFIDSLDQRFLTILHTVRIPVELVLYWLFVNHAVPQLMTYEGRNFDIFSGLTAPLVWYFGYVRKWLNRFILLIWNFVCLGLLVNISANSVLSLPFPFQRFAFEQPNTAVLYFPFVWLPSCIVPLVLFSHLASIRQLLLMKPNRGRRHEIKLN